MVFRPQLGKKTDGLRLRAVQGMGFLFLVRLPRILFQTFTNLVLALSWPSPWARMKTVAPLVFSGLFFGIQTGPFYFNHFALVGSQLFSFVFFFLPVAADRRLVPLCMGIVK